MVRHHPPTTCLPFLLCLGCMVCNQLLEIWAFMLFITLLCMESEVRWSMPISERCGHLNRKLIKITIIFCVCESTSYLL